VLRVSPYLSSFSSTQVISITCFHEPAIFKSLYYKLPFKLIKQELQTSNYSKVINHVIKLSTWWLLQTSGYSYLRVAVIWINVHPTGENPINTTCTFPTPVHVRSSYASYGRSPYVTTFYEPSTELSRATASEKRGSRHNPQHADWSVHGFVLSFSPEPTNEAVGPKLSIYRC
jgi:hypothetical protein